MEEPEVPPHPDLDLKVEEHGLLKNESIEPVEEKEEELLRQEPAASIVKEVEHDKMLYVAIPMEEYYRASESEVGNTKKLKSGSKKAPKVLNDKNPPSLELNEPIICDICEEFYRNNVAFALHSIKHYSDNKYHCHLCSYKNTSKYHIEMHVRVHEGTTRYKCEVCQKAFTISTHANEHKYYHTGDKPFQCELCGKKFMFSWFLTSHRRTQHWETVTGKPLVKYDCLTCKKHYTSSTGLKRHNMYHHGNNKGPQNTALCEICGKVLSSKEKLKFHTRIHTGYKPHACTFCPKCFSKKEQLKEHLRVHTGERPYICKVCNKGFTQRSPLRIHERIHTGERPYNCVICEKTFISKSAKDVHMKRCEVAKYLYEQQCEEDQIKLNQPLDLNVKDTCQTKTVDDARNVEQTNNAQSRDEMNEALMKKVGLNNDTLLKINRDCFDFYFRGLQSETNTEIECASRVEEGNQCKRLSVINTDAEEMVMSSVHENNADTSVPTTTLEMEVPETLNALKQS